MLRAMKNDRKAKNGTALLVMEKLSPMETLDRSFDIEFWQRQDATARFSAAWELVEFAHQLKGRDAAELRLQRTLESLQPAAG